MHFDEGRVKDIAIGEDDQIFLANSDEGIAAYSFNGDTLIFLDDIDSGGWAEAITVLPDGTVFLANNIAGIYVYEFDGVNFSYITHAYTENPFWHLAMVKSFFMCKNMKGYAAHS